MTDLYSTQMTPDPVRSAFGGIAIYKLKKVLKNRYNYSTSYLTCEHTFFHNNTKVVVNPRFIFMIDKNG